MGRQFNKFDTSFIQVTDKKLVGEHVNFTLWLDDGDGVMKLGEFARKLDLDVNDESDYEDDALISWCAKRGWI